MGAKGLEHYLDNSATTAVSKAAADTAYRVMTEAYGNPSSLHSKGMEAEAELKHLEGFVIGIQKKLSNERFVANAPEQVVALERKKLSDSNEKIATLKETIAALKK